MHAFIFILTCRRRSSVRRGRHAAGCAATGCGLCNARAPRRGAGNYVQGPSEALRLKSGELSGRLCREHKDEAEGVGLRRATRRSSAAEEGGGGVGKEDGSWEGWLRRPAWMEEWWCVRDGLQLLGLEHWMGF